MIDILCLDKYDEDDLDGIAELVESINLQPMTGCVHSAPLSAHCRDALCRRAPHADLVHLVDVGDSFACLQPD